MKAYSEDVIEEALSRLHAPAVEDALHIEPAVPFIRISTDKYDASEPFDYAVLCQSPGYTPRTSDALIPIIGEYIQFDQRCQSE
jgi:hypothetical protein